MNNELYHHGILGQKWGVRRFQNKDGSYTNAGKKRRNQSGDNTEKNEKVKRGTKTGAVVCGSALAAIGSAYLYKTGRLDGVIDSGKDIFESAFNRKVATKNSKVINIHDSIPERDRKMFDTHQKLMDDLKAAIDREFEYNLNNPRYSKPRGSSTFDFNSYDYGPPKSFFDMTMDDLRKMDLY